MIDNQELNTVIDFIEVICDDKYSEEEIIKACNSIFRKKGSFTHSDNISDVLVELQKYRYEN